MLVVAVTKAGGPKVLEIQERPAPVAGAGEVLIDVAAAGLNRSDSLQREGMRYNVASGSSTVLGLEVSGRIAALGEGVEAFTIGDEVVALLSDGGYAERVAVPTGQVVAIPDGIDIVTAAALPEVAATVYSNLVMWAKLKPGETVLIHGGASGIGTMAVQLAKALGARVAVTAGTAPKLAAVAELGADILINYREQDFVSELKTATQGRGADVILDVVGGDYLGRNVEALNVSGRLVIIGLQGGSTAELDIAALLAKRASIMGAFLRSRPLNEKTEIMHALVTDVWPLITAGRIRIPVSRTFPLTEAVAAHEYFDSGVHVGKVLLTMR